MPNGSQIGAGWAKLLAGERDVHDLNFTFIVLYPKRVFGSTPYILIKGGFVHNLFKTTHQTSVFEVKMPSR